MIGYGQPLSCLVYITLLFGTGSGVVAASASLVFVDMLIEGDTTAGVTVVAWVWRSTDRTHIVEYRLIRATAAAV